MRLSLRSVRVFLASARVWLVLFLLLAWALRLYHLDTMSLWWDESLSWDRALQDVPGILSNTIRIQNVITTDLHPPLYFLLLHAAVRLWGTTEFGMRFLSAGISLLTVALFYPFVLAVLRAFRFLRQGRAAALLTALFAALSPFYVWYAQEARPYALVLLLSMLALYGLLKWLARDPRTWRDLLSPFFLLFVAALAATLATNYLVFTLFPFLALTMLLLGDRRRDRLTSPCTALAVLLMLAFGGVLLLLPRGAAAVTGSDSAGPGFVPFFIMLRDVWNSFAVGVTANLDTVALLDLALVGLWALGIASTIQVRAREFRLALFLLAYLLAPALALQVGSYLRPLYLNSRHLITVSPAFYIGIALGVTALAARIANGQAVRRSGLMRRTVYAAALAAGAGVFIGGAIYSLNNLYNDPAYAKDSHKEWSQFLRERLRPDDYLILVAPQAEKIVQYYAPDGLKWESLPTFGKRRRAQTYFDREAVLRAYREHGRVWFLEIHQPVGDPRRVIGNLLHRYGEPVDIVWFPGISSRLILTQFVYRSAAVPEATEIPNPQELSFDENLQLVGYHAPAQLEAGSHAAVNLYWRLKEKTPHELSVSLRVVDQDGKVWGQWDAPPVGNLFPTFKWQPHETLLDRHDLVVDPGAPPGKYAIELSVYRAAGHEPLTARLVDGTATVEPIRLAELEVTRPAPPLDPEQLIVDQQMDVQLGDALRLVGYDIDEREPDPGSTIPLTLYFQVLNALERNVQGHVELAAPWWQVWNRTRSSAPLTLDLQGRLPGDIVQTRVGARVPGDASAGEYELRLTLDGLPPQGALGSLWDVVLGAVQVQPVVRQTELPPIANPLNARLGEAVELVGYDLRAPEPLEPGAMLTLTLYWRARAPMDTSYTVFTHLIDGGNQIFGQHDAPPMNGARPTLSWTSGEVIADPHTLTVNPDAPPGTYQIEIGMYDPLTNVRLPTFDAYGAPLGDRLLLQELRVQ